MADRWAQEFNGDDDEDQAYQRAIAESLGRDPATQDTPKKRPVMVDLTPEGAKRPKKQAVTIDLTEDDIETASEASSPAANSQAGDMKPVAQKTESVAEDKETKRAQPQQSVVPAPVSSMTQLGLDRAKMEQERLERIRKRKAAEEGPGDGSDSKRMRTDDENRLLPTAAGPSVLSGEKKAAASSQQQNFPPKKEHSNLPFPKGVVKKTWVKGQPRLGDDITIQEVLQKDILEMAVISSFQWDQDWLFKVIDQHKTRMILVSQEEDEARQEAMHASAPADRVQFVFPRMAVQGNMHSKLQILKFPGYLRIVIPTGNFVPYDWGETGVMENMVFLIDLPLIEEPAKATSKMTQFGEDFVYFLKAQGIPDRLIRSLAKYNFEETKRYGFVHSIAGSHAEESWRQTGYCGLGRTVRALGLSTSDPVQVDIVCSSLGAINYDFLQMFYNACQGDSGLVEYNGRTARKKPLEADLVIRNLERLRSVMRIYFPSEQTINQSLGGKDNAGTIYFQSKWWNQTTFPKAVLRDCKSKRPGMLMHGKAVYVTTRNKETPSPGWAYVGSANLSESAWGRLVKDKASGKPKITCRNWECGVVVAVPTPGPGDRQARDMGMFEGLVPVPMQMPGAPYVDRESERSGSSGGMGTGKVLLRPWCLEK